MENFRSQILIPPGASFNGTLSASLTPGADITYNIGSAALRWTQIFVGPTGLKLGNGTNGPTITATGSSPNESLVLTSAGTGSVLIPSTGTLKFGATAAATIGVSADTTSGILTFTPPSVSGTARFEGTITTVTVKSTSGGQGAALNFETNSGNGNLQFAGTTLLQLKSSTQIQVIQALGFDSSTRSGPGAISVQYSSCKVTTTGALDALTLANGFDGQVLRVIHAVDGGSFVLTPTTKSGWSTFTSTAAGESILLTYYTTIGWTVSGSYLGTIAP